MPDIIGYGSTCLDLALNLPSMPVPDDRTELNEMSWQYGGTISNGLCQAAVLGAGSIGMVGLIGGSIGELCLNDLKYHGIDTSQMIHTETGENRLTIVLSYLDTGKRSFLGRPKTMRSLLEVDIDTAYMDGAKLIYVNRSEPGVIKAAKYAHEHGIKVLMDCDIATPTIKELLSYVDYAISSEKCFRTLFPDLSEREGIEEFRKLCADHALMIVTLGERGLIGVDDDGYFDVPAFKVNVADTSGCGDVFHGAFIAGVMRGLENRENARFSSAVSAIKATVVGCHAGLPTRNVVEKFLETGEIDDTEIMKRREHYRRMPFV